MYNIKKDYWINGPVMVEPRSRHSCCVKGTMLYAVCGINKDYQSLGSIEALSIKNWIEQ